MPIDSTQLCEQYLYTTDTCDVYVKARDSVMLRNGSNEWGASLIASMDQFDTSVKYEPAKPLEVTKTKDDYHTTTMCQSAQFSMFASLLNGCHTCVTQGIRDNTQMDRSHICDTKTKKCKLELKINHVMPYPNFLIE
ncbi:hypothetical protein EGR_07959 [Echinococcus granulosus]|uniref:Uncharacterized protein n=1 Tax=Echinococcus granulosus TaxID=6210 RepID=W6U7Q5_ECHGR|nr:hypothetical protein EGR_07959 [Echinococcus granulosus]EUB57210.1 hypothetical protein EGR_07959 [Echinococcus granulosus]